MTTTQDDQAKHNGLKTTRNARYGLTEPYHHDLDDNSVCKKCNQPISDIKLKLCPVIGREEVARFRNDD